MSILTKEERANHRSRSEAATCSQWMIRSIARDVDFCPYTELIRALDTIDALEAERDALKIDLYLWKKTASGLHAQLNWMAGMIGRIKTIATASHDTRVIDTRIIDGTHASLREILAVIEGGESYDSIRRVTCKCINGGETTINWRTGCGETLCHAELIDDEEGER